MSTDLRDLKAEVKRVMAREDFKEKELSAYSPIDRWFGVEGINVPLGDPRFSTDDMLERAARRMARGLQDVRDGFAERAEPDLTNRQVAANLREVERHRAVRDALRYTWLAVDRMHPCGTDDRLAFEDAGGLPMLAEASRGGQEPLMRPTYKLALFLDWERSLRGLVTALVWPSDDGKGGAMKSR